jgi:plasmid replication initiation protein
MGDQLIKQHNAITTARYDMSATEKNIVYMLLAQLRDDDPFRKTYTIYLQELQKNLEMVGQKVDREQFEEATKKLVSRVYSIEEPSGDFLQLALIASAKHTRYSNHNDIAELEISKSARPYLFQLKNNFTAFQLHMALSLKSKFSKRIYEMLSMYKDVGIMHITIEELKYRLGLIDPKTKEEHYKGWSTFAAQVLEVAKKEIQAYTNIAFTYTLKKTGRKYTDITFHIKTKPVQTLLELNI